MQINPAIFKEYDIRGIYPDEIEMNAVYRIASAFVKFLEAEHLFGPVMVGRDARKSSPELYEVCTQAVLDQGRDVIGIETATTPLFYYSVAESKAAGGIMITASHNPKQYNGMKMVKEGAVPIGFEHGIRVIKEFSSVEIPRKQSQGKKIERSYLSKYVEFLRTYENFVRPIKLVVDASNGSAGEIVRNAFAGTNVELVPLFFAPDGDFPNHSPNPFDDESIRSASKKVIESVSEFGVVIDGDGDRIVFLNENGKRVRSDVVGAYLADHLLRPGDVAVMTKRVTKAFREAVEGKGGDIIFSRVGHSNVKEKMREVKGVFGVEPSGHIYFQDFHYAESALLALVYLLSFFSEQEKKFSEVVAPYNVYHSSELNFKIENSKYVIDRLKEVYKDGVQDEFYGLTVEYPSWWFNVSTSNTEPLLRLTVEADTKELLEKKQKELESKIK
ncbi:MAG: phosphomannomutase/phosphoglucomutase [Candidatus Niyogibacteria bacterium]|nr:phosphomannomutase/phosphoglucomutase [Candidatus Niyogibacteria bacterium]